MARFFEAEKKIFIIWVESLFLILLRVRYESEKKAYFCLMVETSIHPQQKNNLMKQAASSFYELDYKTPS